MSHVSYPFKEPNKANFKKPTTAISQDAIYWNKLGSPVLVKEFGAIDYLDFSPGEPYYFAATCSVRVQIYDPITKSVTKNISKFVQAAYGATFRSDGKLLLAGSEEAVVKLFDVASKNVLRVFSGHTGPVHRTYFTKDQRKVLSFSDDKSACVWDIGVEEKIGSYSEHSDYVRAGAASPISPDLFMSGSYDKTVRLHDIRTKEAVLTVNHGSPVESTIFLPSGGIFISAGGTEIKVWDIFNGGKLLSNISQHHKTVTSLCLANNNSKLMSGSLDRHVKIYDVSTFNVVHSIDYPNAILSMAISENDDCLAVGMVDGIISIRKRHKAAPKASEKQGLVKFAPDKPKLSRGAKANIDMYVSSKKRRVKVSEFEINIRKMEYAKALSNVLKNYNVNKHPENVAVLLQELLKRKVLHIAYRAIPERDLRNLLRFFIRNLGETRFTTVIIDAGNMLIDVFDSSHGHILKNPSIMKHYKLFNSALKAEIDVCQRLCEIEGGISLLLSAAQASLNATIDLTEMAPSSSAKKGLVIDV